MKHPDSGAFSRVTQPTALPDALGAVRAQMRVLKACEAQLRQALIEARPNGPVEGTAYAVTLRQATRKVLDHARLPAYIRDDPAFYRASRSITVVTRPIAHRQAEAQPPEGEGEEDDFEVIERFA